MKQGTKTNMQLLWEFTRGSRKLFLISLISAALSALADMLTPQIVRMAVDNAIGGQEGEYAAWVMEIVDRLGGFSYLGTHLILMSAAIFAVGLVKALSQYCYRVFTTKGAETLVKSIRDMLYEHIEHLPFSWHRNNHTGDIIQRCTSDVDTVRKFFSEQITNLLRIVILLVFSVSFMFSMNTKLAWISVIPIPFIMTYSVIFRLNMKRGFRKCDENEGILSAMVQENLTGVRVVRAFGKERYEKDRFDRHNEYYTSLWVRLGKVMSLFFCNSDLFATVQTFLVVLFGAVFCVRGEITAGCYIAFMSYNRILTWPIRMMGRMISEMSKAGVSISRLGEILNAEEEEDDPEAEEWDMTGDIAFSHVNYSYADGKYMLEDVSFEIKAGTTLGILGGTGSGKSTLMMLLDKMYRLPEDGGEITIGGQDIRKIRTPWLRSHIGYVLQETFLFSRTLGENIRIANPNATDSDMRAAASDACLEETVAGFTKGYETFVGERGVTLSGGQKQRTAIARELIDPKPIMIFDDSLSAVDTETDARIRAALERRFGTATIILISHRITTLSKADKIIVLDKGRVAEEGTHEDLIHAGGFYQKVYELQSGIEGEVTA